LTAAQSWEAAHRRRSGAPAPRTGTALVGWAPIEHAPENRSPETSIQRSFQPTGMLDAIGLDVTMKQASARSSAG